MIYIVETLAKDNGQEVSKIKEELNKLGYEKIEISSTIHDVPSGCMYHDGTSIKKML